MKDTIKEFFKMFGKLFGNKYLLIVVVVAVTGLLGIFGMRSCQIEKHEAAMQTYQRQVSGHLTKKEQELQKLRAELGVAKSELVTQQDLAERLKNDKEEVDEDFNSFVEEHNLAIRSRDRTIARLQGIIKGGTSDTTVTPIDPNDKDICSEVNKCAIGYFWSDSLKRFMLKDPNIFEQDDEVFESNQLFKVYGEIWEQQDGSLQIKRLVLREMYVDEDGKHKPIPDGKAEILESDFAYHNPPVIDTEWQWTEMFRLRGIAVGGVQIIPDTGHLTFGFGLEFFTIVGFGVGSYTSLDFQAPENIAQHISIQYNPTIFDTELNLGVFVSVGTPFVRPFQDYQFNTGLVFYFNQ